MHVNDELDPVQKIDAIRSDILIINKKRENLLRIRFLYGKVENI